MTRATRTVSPEDFNAVSRFLGTSEYGLSSYALSCCPADQQRWVKRMVRCGKLVRVKRMGHLCKTKLFYLSPELAAIIGAE